MKIEEIIIIRNLGIKVISPLEIDPLIIRMLDIKIKINQKKEIKNITNYHQKGSTKIMYHTIMKKILQILIIIIITNLGLQKTVK